VTVSDGLVFFAPDLGASTCQFTVNSLTASRLVGLNVTLAGEARKSRQGPPPSISLQLGITLVSVQFLGGRKNASSNIGGCGAARGCGDLRRRREVVVEVLLRMDTAKAPFGHSVYSLEARFQIKRQRHVRRREEAASVA
jgi:hypothetical protein